MVTMTRTNHTLVCVPDIFAEHQEGEEISQSCLHGGLEKACMVPAKDLLRDPFGGKAPWQQLTCGLKPQWLKCQNLCAETAVLS